MRGAGVAGAVLAAALVIACFSERGEPIAAGSLDCALPLDSTTVGTVAVIAIRDLSFQPAEVRVPAGTRVVWVNCERASDAVAHTATADADAFDSGLLAPGERYAVRFPEAGTFDYHCEPHPFMRARIIVE